MPLIIGVPKEITPDERRIAVTPEVVKKYKSLGADIHIERDAGLGSFFQDDDFGASFIATNSSELFSRSEVILKVQPPSPGEILTMGPGTVLAGFLHPYGDRGRAELLCNRNITSFSLELLPRISRAQSMDALSSQATVAGYQSVLIAAKHCVKFFPMITYAAGTLRPARVLVIGAGVAGLQAIATAHRLGAIVEAYDVRPETREQIESLGAKFVDTGVSATAAGGYARGLTAEEKNQESKHLSGAVARADVLITTAAIPGRRSPRIITHEMVQGMNRGSVIVDLAADTGGNVTDTRPGEIIIVDGITVIGPVHLASQTPVHASEMYSKNLFNFLSPFIKDGKLSLEWNDEILSGSVFTHAGEIRNDDVKKSLGIMKKKNTLQPH